MPNHFPADHESPADSRPRIAITVGDAAGIGPELSLRCAAADDIVQRCTPILYGPRSALQKISATVGLPPPTRCRDLGSLNAEQLVAGHFDRDTGLASFQAFDQAITDALHGRVDAIVTGPIQKEAWNAAGIPHPGHTEVLAERCGTDDVAMMLTSPEISCVLATIHAPLADVPGLLTTESIGRAIRLGAAAISASRQRPARVAVCGLNPHAGENGLLGHGEEARIILPAIRAAREDGLDVVGPLSPDTAFTPSMRKSFDLYVCMYHDQGLIPLKALAFDDAVNVTLGLPIVRTSVDHGTALDLAWRGVANDSSMRAAIEMAIELAQARRRTTPPTTDG